MSQAVRQKLVEVQRLTIEAMAALPREPEGEVPELSERETDILHYVADGLSSRQIGVRLQLSPRTIDGHRERLMKKAEVANTVHLVRWAIRMGILQP